MNKPPFPLVFTLLLLMDSAANGQTSDKGLDAQVRKLLARMTLEEKVGQMTQVDFKLVAVENGQDAEDPVDPQKLEYAILERHVGSILNAPTTPNNKAQPVEKWRRITQAVRDAAARTRLKIPVIYGIDANHGASYTRGATLFPQPLSLAATFNTDLAFKEGEVTAREIKASGLDWNFDPVMDIGRQPLWPRLWETYGEDVHLASAMGSAFIRGHQGDDFGRADKAPTCLKHYVGYGYPLNGKDRTPAWIGERALREYFLPSFQAGVLAGAPTVMVNSSEVDGLPGHANHEYLTTILRGELGFKGFTVSDWEDIIRLHARDKLAATPREAVKIAVMAGVDMSMVPLDFSFYDLLLDLARSGEVPMARIDEAVSRILKVKYQSGLFDPKPLPPVAGNFATESAAAINRQAAREAIILAKNADNLLPLKKDASLLVTGPTANLLSVLNGGWTLTWQGDDESLYPHDHPTLLQAIKAKATGRVTYIGGQRFGDEINIEAAVNEAKSHDVVILALGEQPYTETLGNIDSLRLEARQTQLAQALIATGKPVVLVYYGGRPRTMTEVVETSRAVVLGFLPGMEGGAATSEILFGEVNPSGRLPISYPRDTNNVVPYDYKPMEDFAPNQVRVLFPFGHGLSYTRFETSGLRLARDKIKLGEPVDVSVNVKNIGQRAGQETVLVYLNDVAASVSRPNRQLKAFKKLELQPGQQAPVHFRLTSQDMSFIGIDRQRVVEPGEFKVMVGHETASFTVLPK